MSTNTININTSGTPNDLKMMIQAAVEKAISPLKEEVRKLKKETTQLSKDNIKLKNEMSDMGRMSFAPGSENFINMNTISEIIPDNYNAFLL